MFGAEAARALARLLWVNEPAEGTTIAIRVTDNWLLLKVVIHEGQKEKWFRPVHWDGSVDHVLPGTLLSIDPTNQPMWYVKQFLAPYLFHVPHAV